MLHGLIGAIASGDSIDIETFERLPMRLPDELSSASPSSPRSTFDLATRGEGGTHTYVLYRTTLPEIDVLSAVNSRTSFVSAKR